MELQAIWDKADSLRGCLSHLKTGSGRRKHQDSEFGDGFITDEVAILESKVWRRLADKTQVITQPSSTLIRTRQAHVHEVAAASMQAAEALGLNTNLVRAAAYGHDIGHVPFGHQGEAWMAKAMDKNFCHEVMGPIIAQKIERRGHGLNLTHETLEAMMRHSGDLVREGMSQEAWTLRYTDKIAYLFADINDLSNSRRINYPLPAEILKIAGEFGDTQRRRKRTAISALVIESAELGKVCFEFSELGRKFQRLRELMLKVYPKVTQQNVGEFMEPVLEFLTNLNLCKDPFMLLALMSDSEAIRIASTRMRDMSLFNQTSLGEMVPYLAEIGEVDLCDPCLNW